MPPNYFKHIESNPLKEMRDIQIIRDIIDSQFIYKPAFDLNNTRMHFYCDRTDIAADWMNFWEK